MTHTFAEFYTQFGLILAKRSILGFPDAYAAQEWLYKRNAGPCSYIVNGSPYPNTWHTELS
jgi:hypothetical protein